MLKKVSDFYQTAVVNDLQCVAYAYRPIAIEKEADAPDFDPTTPGFLTLPVRITPDEDKGLNPSSDSGSPPSDSDEKDGRLSEESDQSQDVRPPMPRVDIGSLPDPVNIVIEIGGGDSEDEHHYGSSTEEAGVSSSKVESGPLQRWRKLRELDMADEREDIMDSQPPLNSTEFCEEAVQGQIFLGMTTLAHQPKTVRPHYC